MEGIPGVPAPIPHSKIAGPHKVRVAGSGAGVSNNPTRLPMVKLGTLSQLADMTPKERGEYTRSVGGQATARVRAKVVDILA